MSQRTSDNDRGSKNQIGNNLRPSAKEDKSTPSKVRPLYIDANLVRLLCITNDKPIIPLQTQEHFL